MYSVYAALAGLLPLLLGCYIFTVVATVASVEAEAGAAPAPAAASVSESEVKEYIHSIWFDLYFPLCLPTALQEVTYDMCGPKSKHLPENKFDCVLLKLVVSEVEDFASSKVGAPWRGCISPECKVIMPTSISLSSVSRDYARTKLLTMTISFPLQIIV